jgi:hypothetical protein
MIMRRSLFILPALLLLASSTPNAPATAHVVPYAISFTGKDAPTVVGSNIISYDFSAGCFISPASLVLSYQGNDYTLSLATPQAQANAIAGDSPPNPDLDKFGWGAGPLSDKRAEIFLVDLSGPTKIYIDYAGQGVTIEPSSGKVGLTEAKH